MQALQISVNGESLAVPSGSRVSDLLTLLQLPPDRVAIELNKSLIRKNDWAATIIPTGAHFEIVEFVGGG